MSSFNFAGLQRLTIKKKQQFFYQLQYLYAVFYKQTKSIPGLCPSPPAVCRRAFY